ncbi:MAG: LysR family transcriptional regulator [Betaproteobacteria bacterium]|nr:LysR family transcriptional regulator [Betaproteobacteria bacterium]
MNLRQMQYVCEIARRDLNISAVAAALHTNQPGISKQVKLLETELGIEIFVRSRNRLSGITPHGQKIIAMAQAIVNEMANIKSASRDVVQESSGSLVIAVTHTQARYVLPEVIKKFAARYPKVRITMRHADPERIVEMLLSGHADLGVTTNDPPKVRDLIVLPCREFQRVVIVPRGHQLQRRRLTLKELARYPLVTYEPAFTSRETVIKAFAKRGLEPKVVLSAIDADVIKSCVEQGLGIAVLSEVTFEPQRDQNLCAIPAGHLFDRSVTKIWLCRNHHVRRYTYDFIEICAPRWTRSSIEHAMAARTGEAESRHGGP